MFRLVAVSEDVYNEGQKKAKQVIKVEKKARLKARQKAKKKVELEAKQKADQSANIVKQEPEKVSLLCCGPDTCTGREGTSAHCPYPASINLNFSPWRRISLQHFAHSLDNTWTKQLSS